MSSTTHTIREPVPGPAQAPATAAAPLAGGVAVITAAKAWFLLAGYALFFGLTRLLGPEGFGLYAVAISIVSVVNNVLVAASLQTVSRFVAAAPDGAGGVLRRAAALHAALGLVIFLALVALAPALARAFRDPDLTQLLRISAAIPFAYAVYAALVGFLNGRGRFVWQATLDASFSTLKTALVLIGAVALGVSGAVGGFAVAAWVVLAVALVVVWREPRPDGALDVGAYLGFGGWLVGLTAVSSLVLSVDLWIVKRLADAAVANRESGLFRAALTLSQLLFQLLIPLSLVVFPSLARLGADAPEERGRVVKGALRYLVLVLLPAATVLAFLGGELLALLYGAEYRAGGAWLLALAPGYAAWTAAYLLATALAGGGRPRAAVGVLAAGLGAQIAAGVLLFGRYGTAGMAAGDAIGMMVALACGLVVARRVFGAIVPWSSLGWAAGISAVLGTIAALWPAANGGLVARLAVLGAVGLAGLWACGELRPLLARFAKGRGRAA